MSSDDWSIFRVLKDAKRELRATYARPCPVCQQRLPKAPPSMLLPRQKCRIHGYQDLRPRLSEEQVNEVFARFGLKREGYERVKRKEQADQGS